MNKEIIKPVIFANNLRLLMEKKGITQNHIEEGTGISQSTISRYLRPNARPSRGNVMMIARYLRVSPAWLARGEGPKYPEIPEEDVSLFQDKKLAREINAVYLAGNGTETRLFVDKRVDLNASVLGNSIIVEWAQGYADAPLLTDSISIASLSQGSWINIRNASGVKEIENT